VTNGKVCDDNHDQVVLVRAEPDARWLLWQALRIGVDWRPMAKSVVVASIQTLRQERFWNAVVPDAGQQPTFLDH